jgi:DNA primase small subunit
MPTDDQFSTDLLAMYYDRLFPYDQMTKWLGYTTDTSSNDPNSRMARREFSFTLQDDVYIRYKAFRNAEEMKAEMKKYNPHKIDIGAVFSVSVSQTQIDLSRFILTSCVLVVCQM